jgi:N-acetylmuramoyl-L-alanine amidase
VVVAALVGWASTRGDGDRDVATSAPATTVVTEPPTTTTTTVAPTTTSTTDPPVTTTTASRPAPTTSTTRPAPPPLPPRETSGRLAGKVIAVDPGHNGGNYLHTAEINQLVPAGGFDKPCDTTGTATNGGYSEARFAFNVANYLADDLRAMGATVVLTRDSNSTWGPCVDERARIGNDAHADAAISIHADGGPSSGRGFDVIRPGLIAGYTEGIVGPSADLALAVRAAFLAGTGVPYANYIGTDGLDTRTDLGGLNLSTVPKVLIECLNMRNDTDAALITDDEFQQLAGRALATGIADFLS